MPRSRSASAAAAIRSRLRSIVRPKAVNSWPKRMGVASWRWVRPDLRIPSNALPFARNAPEHLRCRAHDRVRERGVEPPRLLVGEGGGFLDQNDRVDEGGERSEVRDREVAARPLGLDPI